MLKRLLVLILCMPLIVWAGDIPDGYYDDVEGKTGEDLKSVLHDIIGDHTSLSYSELWNAFQNTDCDSDGYIWDMYSDVPGGTASYVYTYSTDQCGNDGYSGEGDCYNREHSFPKSWFGGKVEPMYTDLFHVVPSDGYVNSQRSNYPYGEVDNPTWTSTNGCKLGPCSTSGYSGTVFEPIDEYKGDFARGYFYMATRYYGEDSSWPGSDMVDGAEPKAWALAMLMRWHEADPVSQKEIDRNNVIYSDYQHNRNPFIDHPEYIDKIWGDVEPNPSYVLDLTFDSDLENCTAVGVSGSIDWEYNSSYTCAYINTHGEGVNESWLVTPVVNLDTIDNETFTFDVTSYNESKTIAACGSGQFELYYSANYDGTNFSTAQWTRITSVDDVPLGNKWDFVTVSVDVTEIQGNQVYFAFAHACGEDDGTTWEVDNVSLSGDVATPVISHAVEETIYMYPNPASTSISLSQDAVSVKVIALSGEVVLVKNAVVADDPIDISQIESGIYLIKISSGKSVFVQKMVKR